MFGSSNPFGQASSSSPFGTQFQSVFGQTNNMSNNPFAPKPFGTSTPFGAQTGSSMFGGTSTAVFGAPQTSSPFGASSQALGTSTPAFGGSSAPAFGSSTSPFGGSSTFGQKSFGLSTPQSSPFGSTTQQSQPAFGNNTFGSSTPFGASNTPAFGASSTPAFGATNTPGFGATSMPAFGASSTPAFGATNTPAFGATGTPGFGATSTPGFGDTSTPGFGASSTSAFGSTNTPAFGASSTPSFGASSSPAFGASPTPAFGSSGTAFGNNAFGSGGAFGASSTSAFGASSTPAFGASSTPAFGASSSPSFNFGNSPAFGQSTSAFGSSSFGSTQSSFGAQGSNPMFGGQSTIRGQQGGSRVMPYAPTTETESANGGQPTGKLQSISAMPVHKEKSQEELRWEDYQRGDKGGQLPAGQSPGGTGFGVTNSQPSLFSVSPAFGQKSTNQANPFSSSIATNTFAPTITPKISSPFGQTPSIFGSTSSNTTSVFGSSSGLATNTSQPFGSSVFSSAPAQGQGSTPAFSIGQTPIANATGFSLGLGALSQGGNFGQVSAPTSSAVMPIPVTNPFGTLPALSQISIAQGGNSPKIQYGISSLPVVDKPAPVRVSPLLTSRHLLQRRVRLPTRKYRPGDDIPKL